MPPTQLLANPNTPKKNTETQIVAIMMPESSYGLSWMRATIVGIKGVRPKMEKLKNVTMLLVKGFY